MPLNPGSKLGPYEIVAPLGAGGMGEVYRARDPRLGRDVAIKVLPESLAGSPEIRARFEREARTVSSLNHPNICTLFDVGREGETHFLVLELIEGETLADRLARGALPTDQTLTIGAQVADALDRAHRAGVIHRDLKPGNVMLTRSGAKLMDFGLARPTGLAGSSSRPGTSQSPTMSAPLTAEGTILGTFQYMAPEQLEGQETDARSDIWALGCVLYEMATGKHAFEGKSQASLIGAIMNSEPAPLSQLVPAAPPGLDRLVRACLAKDPDERIQTSHDVKLQLRWIQEGGSQSGVPAPVAASAHRRGANALIAALVALVIGAMLGAVGDRLLSPSAPKPTLRFGIPAGPTIASTGWPLLSPDGRTLVFLAADTAGQRRVWARPLDALQAHEIPGGERAQRPFWSPDGRSLGYIRAGKLYRAALSGGASVAVADVPGGADGTWAGNTILYDGSGTDSIRGVPATGGKVFAATRLDRARGESGHSWPFFLPDGKHFLFVCTIPSQQTSEIKMAKLGSLESRTVGQTDSRALFADGYLLYTINGALLAQRFDPGSAKASGDPIPIADRIVVVGGSGDFTVSQGGVLAYRTVAGSSQTRLVWFDRTGRMLGDAAPPGDYDEARLSPDGRRVALRIMKSDATVGDIWVRDLTRNVTSRLTFDSFDKVWPVWSPDGSRIAYASNRGGEFHIYTRSASGVGGEDSVAHVAGGQAGPTDWSPDGRTIAASRTAESSWDLWLHPVGGHDPPIRMIQTPSGERTSRFSPDGRWLAFTSNESGRNEIYVVPVIGSGGKWQVSTAGGDDPFWTADGKEILYIANDRTITVVPVSTGVTFEPGTPQPLFRAELAEGMFVGARWSPTPDGQRFLLLMPTGGGAGTTFTVVTNWAEELKKKR